MTLHILNKEGYFFQWKKGRGTLNKKAQFLTHNNPTLTPRQMKKIYFCLP